MFKTKIVFLVILFIPLILSGQNFWQIEQLPKLNDRDGIGFTDIACGADGSVHMIFTESDRNGEHLMYTKKAGGTWSDPVMVQAGGGGWYSSAVAADVNGLAHIIFANNGLRYWNSNPGFGEPVEIITDSYPDLDVFHPEIAVDNNQDLHIVFLSWDGAGNSSTVYYSNNTSGDFVDIISIASNAWHHYTNIALDENNKVGIVFHRETGPVSAFCTFYSSNVTGPFIAPVEVSMTPTDSTNTIAAEIKMSNGYAYITYSQDGGYPCVIGCKPGQNDIYFTKVDASTGAHAITPVPIVLRVGWDNFGMGFYPASGGNPAEVHVAYYDYHEVQGRKSTYWRSGLCYVVVNGDDGGLLQSPETVYDEASVGEPSMEMDADGFAHIAFHSDGNPMYATNIFIPGGIMHISDVSVSTQSAGKDVKGVATVTILDENSAPVPDVTVSGVWSGLTSDSDQFLTGSNGSGTAESDKVSKKASGMFIFTVTDVSRSGWTYNPAANTEESGSAPWPALGKPGANLAEDKVPSTTALIGNYPNPFNPSTTIRYQLAKAQQVSLIIFDINGEAVMNLSQGMQQPGIYEVVWDGTRASGFPVASGIYFLTLDVGNTRYTQKMTLKR